MIIAETEWGRWRIATFFAVAAGLMIAAAAAELILGVRAERRSLEDVATPLTAIQQETGTSA